jgi:putative PEP-CTERM system histidine kinase
VLDWVEELGPDALVVPLLNQDTLWGIAYLVVMAVAGYGLREAGGEWGPVLQATFFFGAALLLGWIIMSPAARANLRVFIAKHFYRTKYDYRREWIRLTQRLSENTPGETLEHRGLDAMVSLANAEGGALWLREKENHADGYIRVAEINLDDAPRKITADDPLVMFLDQKRWIVDLGQALREPDSHPGLFVLDWVEELGPDALVVPLLNQDTLWGIAYLAAPRAVGHLSYEDIDLFRIAGMQVAAVLAQAEADRLLAESRQFDAYNRFAAFIMHDLKNVIAQQSLVVRNAAKYRDDPAFIDDALDTVANSVERMQKLLGQLKRGQGDPQVERVDVHRLLLETVNRHTDRDPAPTASCDDARLRLRVDRERFAAVLGHLVTNAQDATPAGGRVTIEAAMQDGRLVVAVEDDGSGMDEAFLRERLFKPFDSTKGSRGMGIGAYQARQFVEAAGGEVHVRSAPGEGTRFEMRFPARLVETGTGETGQFMAPGFGAASAEREDRNGG